ncbi:ABC transporter permease [Sulfobacillus thermosulfidooxidans]|uniref:ABC transporter permease n=1 Tax=Sulfobacillus thermosulfidooxidans TaxID=28034 RepID=UPI0006B54DC3|nr:ABC transporter permease [Sulfobacillus thermosulfidooxidans]
MYNLRLIIAMTVKELIRRKTLPILIAMTCLFLIVFDLEIQQQRIYSAATNPLGNLTTLFGDKLLAAFFMNLVIAFIGIFIVAGFIPNDIDNGTLFVVLARPIKRWQLIVGKWLTVAFLELLYLPLVIVTVQEIIVSHFPGAALNIPTLMQLLAAFITEAWVINILALFSSIVLPHITAAIMVGLAFIANFILGSIAPYSPSNSWTHHLFVLFQFLLPTDDLYRRAWYEWNGGASNPLILTGGPFGGNHPVPVAIVIYALFYIASTLWLSCTVFDHLDF